MSKSNNNHWKYWGDSVTGPLHIKLGLPNQDAFLMKRFRWGEVVVVADGLGSKPNSDVGSQAVCKSVVDAAKIFSTVPNADIENLPRLIHTLWRINIGQLEPRNCATTCILGIRYENQLILGQIGDGMLVALGQSPESDFILNPKQDNGFSNLTDCLGAGFEQKYWTIQTFPADVVSALVICTDGIADDLIPERRVDFARSICENYRDFVSVKRKQEIQECLTNWTVPGHTDDKTIVCLYR